MFVALNIGIPQLWVDLYCIDQQDGTSKHDAIASMNLIYGAAEVTIIAASGTNAFSGLPGICGTQRQHQMSNQIEAYTYVRSIDVRHQVSSSRRNTRGWTFQEALLSPRLLLFTESQLYFQYGAVYCLEEEAREFDNWDRPSSGNMQIFPTRGIGTSSFRCYERIKEFFKRDISYSCDSLHAIEGILEAFNGNKFGAMRSKHFYGTPIFYNPRDQTGEKILVGSSLTWRIKKTVSDRGTEACNDASNPGLPSWTWAVRKSTRPHATDELIFVCDPWELADHPEIGHRVQHENGKAVSFLEFTTFLNSQKYLRFCPWIEITSWIIRGHLLSYAPHDIEKGPHTTFLGKKGGALCLDDVRSWEGETIVAVLLGFRDYASETSEDRAVFLLACEATPGDFSRMGLWCSSPCFSLDQRANVRQALEECLGLTKEGDEVVVERRTLRPV